MAVQPAIPRRSAIVRRGVRRTDLRERVHVFPTVGDRIPAENLDILRGDQLVANLFEAERGVCLPAGVQEP